eukprot:9065677-Pyramimonas_sp.AAC.1
MRSPSFHEGSERRPRGAPFRLSGTAGTRQSISKNFGQHFSAGGGGSVGRASSFVIVIFLCDSMGVVSSLEKRCAVSPPVLFLAREVGRPVLGHLLADPVSEGSPVSLTPLVGQADGPTRPLTWQLLPRWKPSGERAGARASAA